MQLETPAAYFVHPVYWEGNLHYTRSYRVSTLKALTGREQRSLLNHYVRRELVYDVITRDQAEPYHLKKYLKAYAHRVWGVPLWQYEMVLSAEAASGQATLSITSTLYREVIQDMSVLLYSNYKTYEVGVVNTVSSTQIVLDSNLSSTWPVGTKAYPIMRSVITSAQEFGAKVPEIFAMNIHFIESYRGDSYA